jgi:hypothetical protein
MKQINDTIDKFLEVELKAHPAQVEKFFERVQSNYDEAIKTATRFLLLMIATWFLTYAIHEGWIDEIEWLSVKFNREMTIVSPFLVGLLSYGMQSALAGAVAFWEAISRRFLYTLPTAWEHQLDDFLAPPTFSNIERMLEPEKAREKFSLCSRGWFLLVTVLMFGGSIAALIHTTYLLMYPAPIPATATTPATALYIPGAWIAVSATLGALAWIRGVVISAYAIEATGGFKFCHHRGERKLPLSDQAQPEDNPQDSPSVSPAPSSQPQSSIIQASVATVPIYPQARLFDLRREGVVLVVERKKRRLNFIVRS